MFPPACRVVFRVPGLTFVPMPENTMPYKTRTDLPDSVQHVLPAHAQDIYKEAFNSAWDEYKHKEERRDDATREETAHRVAWAAVKHQYEKGDDDKWHKKK